MAEAMLFGIPLTRGWTPNLFRLVLRSGTSCIYRCLSVSPSSHRYYRKVKEKDKWFFARIWRLGHLDLDDGADANAGIIIEDSVDTAVAEDGK